MSSGPDPDPSINGGGLLLGARVVVVVLVVVVDLNTGVVDRRLPLVDVNIGTGVVVVDVDVVVDGKVEVVGFWVEVVVVEAVVVL